MKTTFQVWGYEAKRGDYTLDYESFDVFHDALMSASNHDDTIIERCVIDDDENIENDVVWASEGAYYRTICKDFTNIMDE